MGRTEKFKKNNLKMVECCASCTSFNSRREFCNEMEEQVAPFYVCEEFIKNSIKDNKLVLKRLEDICSHANTLEQHVVSLKEYLKTGIIGYVGQRGLPSPENRMSYVKNLVTELPIILKECEYMMEKNDKAWKNVNKALEVIKKTKEKNK